MLPGDYTVKLTVNGKSYTQPLTVKMDPRVTTPTKDIARMFQISFRSYDGMRQAREAGERIRKLRTQLQERRAKAGSGALADAIAALDQKAAALQGSAGGGRRGAGRRGGTDGGTFASLAGELEAMMGLVEGADATPTSQVVAESEKLQHSLGELLGRWAELEGRDLKTLNDQLGRANLPVVDAEAPR